MVFAQYTERHRVNSSLNKQRRHFHVVVFCRDREWLPRPAAGVKQPRMLNVAVNYRPDAGSGSNSLLCRLKNSPGSSPYRARALSLLNISYIECMIKHGIQA